MKSWPLVPDAIYVRMCHFKADVKQELGLESGWSVEDVILHRRPAQA